MSAVADAPPDVVLHPGRRGRVAVLHLRGVEEPDPGVTAARVEHALGLRPRWLVLDVSALAAQETGHLVEAVRRRARTAGVRIAVAGAYRPPSEQVTTAEHGYPTFPTVPIALGTVGAV